MYTENTIQDVNGTRLAYRIDEVAAMFGVSYSTIRRAIIGEQLYAVKLSTNTYVIPKATVEGLLKSSL